MNRTTDNRIFNVEYYALANTGLRDAGITSVAALMNHWISHGYSEGRKAHPSFWVKEYAELHPKTEKHYADRGLNENQVRVALIDHYLNHGYVEGRRGVHQYAPPNWLDHLVDRAGDVRFSNMNTPDEISILASAHDAGAISSITWRGMEFVDDKVDHGRQVQAAVHFGPTLAGGGEEFNPTEAGSSADGRNPSPSSSKNLVQRVSAGALYSEIQMAYWKPVNGAVLSNHVVEKSVLCGIARRPNVIKYTTTFHMLEEALLERHKVGVYVPVSLHFPTTFPMMYRLLLADGSISTAKAGAQTSPLIAATSDGKHAMGMISRAHRDPKWLSIVYSAKFYSTGEKITVAVRIENPMGSYLFTNYVVVGTLSEVADTMMSLYNQPAMPKVVE